MGEVDGGQQIRGRDSRNETGYHGTPVLLPQFAANQGGTGAAVWVDGVLIRALAGRDLPSMARRLARTLHQPSSIRLPNAHS